MKRYQATYREVGVITWVQILEGCPNKIWQGEQRQKFGAIFDNFDRKYLQKSTEQLKSEEHLIKHQPHFIPCWKKKFGKLWSTKKVIGTHVDAPNWTFFRDTICKG